MIERFHNAEALAAGSAEIFVSRAAEAIRSKGHFSVALSGGHTPLKTYEALSHPSLRDRIGWKHIHIFWGDERCVSSSDLRSNYLMASQSLLGHVPIPPSHIHPIRRASSPVEAAEQYESVLRDHFATAPPRFDLVFLGLGENGHTASLFPNDAVLGEETRWVAPVKVPSEGFFRVTLTPLVLNEARLIVFLVVGPNKASALREVLVGNGAPSHWPAKLIRPREGEVLWFVDDSAAAGLGL